MCTPSHVARWGRGLEVGARLAWLVRRRAQWCAGALQELESRFALLSGTQGPDPGNAAGLRIAAENHSQRLREGQGGGALHAHSAFRKIESDAGVGSFSRRGINQESDMQSRRDALAAAGISRDTWTVHRPPRLNGAGSDALILYVARADVNRVSTGVVFWCTPSRPGPNGCSSPDYS